MSDGDYILFYSNKCLHSKEFLTLLLKDPELNKKFMKVNIDNKNKPCYPIPDGYDEEWCESRGCPL